MRVTDDASAAALIRQGHEDGYRFLMEDVLPRAKGALIRKLGQTVETEIEDGLAEAARRVWLSIDAYDADRAPLAHWVYVIARNSVLSDLRRRRSEGDEELAKVVAPPSTRTSEMLAREKRLDQLRSCIEQLSPMQKDIVMCDLETGHSTSGAKLAEKWGTSPNSIRVSRYKAHRRLHQLMRRVEG